VVLALSQLVLVDQSQHGLAGHPHSIVTRKRLLMTVSVLVVDYVAAGLPERFAGADDPFWFTLQFKSHLASSM
jgi:hypothetical protein